MLQLRGGTHFLILRRDEAFAGHSLSIRGKFDEALADWHAGDRISPIFPLDGAEEPNFSDGMKSWALLAGPVDPGALPPELPGKLFLALGLFNLILFTSTQDEREQALSLAQELGVRWEEWELDGASIVAESRSAPAGSRRPPTSTTKPVHDQPPALMPALREYRITIGNCVGRAQNFLPTLEAELLRYNSLVRELLASGKDPVVKLGALVTANASLSRFSSQIFSGSSPITETEAHYWPHSLLGVGIPTLAINNLRRFLETVLAGARFGDRLNALAYELPHGTALHRTPSSAEFWEKNLLFSEGVNSKVAELDPAPAHLPLLTFFSGRDGFRNTEMSLSAPLEIVSSCNATSWTLHTLTHEISHTIVGLTLARLLPKPQHSEELEKAVALLADPSPARNLLEQFKAYFSYSFLVHGRRNTGSVDASPALLSEAIHKNYSKVNEILTHVLDFLYFYEKNESVYIRSVWASWAVIPNIHHRIPDYLLRCLCALASGNLRKEDHLQITIDRLADLLSQVAVDLPAAQYVGEARHLLSVQRDEFVAKLRDSLAFVRFARYVLYAPVVAGLLAKDLLAGPEGAPYNLVKLKFDAGRVSSPLAFSEAFASDLQGNELSSAWILHKLAFSAAL